MTTPIRSAVHDALASHATEYELVRELHTVPPHAVYEVRVDGTRAVCKLETHPEGDPATEGRVLEYVARETSVPVPRVLAVGEDHFVAEWHDGAPASDGDHALLEETRARAAGAGLARLHEETSHSFDRTGLLESDSEALALDGHDTWTDTVCALLENCRAFLADYGFDDVATEAIAFFREHPDAFAGVGDPVLVHGNYLPAHVGVGEGRVACVLDFEHAMVGPAEYDYWATVLPTFESSSAPGDSDGDLRAAFDAGYESVRPLPDGLERRRPLHWAVLGVTYLRSLYLQREWDSRADADRRAERFAASIRETLERERVSDPRGFACR